MENSLSVSASELKTCHNVCRFDRALLAIMFAYGRTGHSSRLVRVRAGVVHSDEGLGILCHIAACFWPVPPRSVEDDWSDNCWCRVEISCTAWGKVRGSARLRPALTLVLWLGRWLQPQARCGHRISD